MRRAFAGRGMAAALATLLLAPAPSQSGPVLQVDAASGQALGRLPLAKGEEVCLSWAHSVTGGDVADCFENRAGRLVLTRSYLHDFAAGLGEVPGRGTLISAADGGYWITGIDEAIPDNRLSLWVGGEAVGHVLTGKAGSLDLSQIAAGQRVSLSLAPPD